VQHFGYDFVYGKNTVFLENPSEKNIPEYCSNILPKISNEIKKIHSLSEVIFQ
jgi:alkylated DNA repair protein alkB family protein 8